MKLYMKKKNHLKNTLLKTLKELNLTTTSDAKNKSYS